MLSLWERFAALTVDKKKHMVELVVSAQTTSTRLKFPQSMMGFFELAPKESGKNHQRCKFWNRMRVINIPPFESTRWCIKTYLGLFKTSQLDLCFSNISDIYVGPSLLRTNNVFFQASPTKNTYLTFTFASTGVVGVGFFQRRLLGVLSMSEIKLKQKT